MSGRSEMHMHVHDVRARRRRPDARGPQWLLIYLATLGTVTHLWSIGLDLSTVAIAAGSRSWSSEMDPDPGRPAGWMWMDWIGNRSYNLTLQSRPRSSIDLR